MLKLAVVGAAEVERSLCFWGPGIPGSRGSSALGRMGQPDLSRIKTVLKQAGTSNGDIAQAGLDPPAFGLLLLLLLSWWWWWWW